MNSDRPEGKGGVPYRPLPRRPIHNYRVENQLVNEIMGRYGVVNNRRENDARLSPQQSLGEDVVDNVLSKMSRQTSPLSIRKKKLPRSNSYSQDEENTDETNVLSKSLPATLPSHLPYSDDSEIEGNFSTHSKKDSRFEEESIHDITNRSNRSNRSVTLERAHLTESSPYQQRLSVKSREISQPQSSNAVRNIFLTLVVIVAVVMHWKFPNMITSITNNSQDKSTQTVDQGKIIFENNMKILQEKYNIDDDSILRLQTGISTIFSRMDSGSFIFVYNSKTNNFNLVRFEKFADEVAYTAARFLRNDISSIRHTVVESSNLDMQEHGELISRYREDVDRSGVMLVKEIDAVPSDLAMAFHYYCDEYDPLVKRSAIFFTLNMANCSNIPDPKSIHDIIEKCLARKWTTLPRENMRPLLTRVVDVVIDVTSVF
ncbi:hypothetical protein PYW07_014732 [Mythimna separata]|uniref:Uncharacterized protein n=1 Tax=Mythimna separata TaxID=271217 RepID=A0AAD7Z025_MYTSE|nr:hypothetical protein PYW07_014732 [Mythimna separata]